MTQPTLTAIAERFIGVREIKGRKHNPQILAMHHAVAPWFTTDEVAWCSSFMCYVAHLAGRVHPKSARARSWLQVGIPVHQDDLILTVAPEVATCTAVIFSRGTGKQPGPDVIRAPGHVGLLANWDHERRRVSVIGGNQNNAVSIKSFPISKVLGLRFIHAEV